jgi:hypothetical protein
MALSPVACFESHDTFLHTMLCFLNPKDVFHVERVCKSWQKAVSELSVWERLFDADNIPAIVDRRPDYKTYVGLRGMFERGVSVEKIEKYYGTPVGKMPRVAPEKYDLMFGPDPEDPAKMMFETYEAVFTPLAIKRTFGKDLAATLDQEDRLKITPQAPDSNSMEYELEIPFSFPNLVGLSRYPLAGKKNGSVFEIYDDDILEQCKSQATKVGIYFMRSNILENSREETFLMQEARAKSLNQEIVPLIVRAFSHTIKIPETGKCPDGQKPHMTYSRTADCVRIEDHSGHVVLGGFTPGAGILIAGHSGGHIHVGVAPGFPAEA